jgi:hypothetical protein
MHFNEELLTDERYLRLNGNQQSELIGKHCTDIEDRIRSASSRLEAVQIKEMACSEFKKECQSKLVRTALSIHVEDIIIFYWDKK